MNVWVSVPTSGRLICVESLLSQTEVTPTFTLKLDKMVDQQPAALAARSLSQMFYPSWSTNPSCFQISEWGKYLIRI